MHDELNRVKKKPKYEEIKADDKPFKEQAEIWTAQNKSIDNSIVYDIFSG